MTNKKYISANLDGYYDVQPKKKYTFYRYLRNQFFYFTDDEKELKWL